MTSEDDRVAPAPLLLFKVNVRRFEVPSIHAIREGDVVEDLLREHVGSDLIDLEVDAGLRSLGVLRRVGNGEHEVHVHSNLEAGPQLAFFIRDLQMKLALVKLLESIGLGGAIEEVCPRVIDVAEDETIH